MLTMSFWQYTAEIIVIQTSLTASTIALTFHWLFLYCLHVISLIFYQVMRSELLPEHSNVDIDILISFCTLFVVQCTPMPKCVVTIYVDVNLQQSPTLLTCFFLGSGYINQLFETSKLRPKTSGWEEASYLSQYIFHPNSFLEV